MINLKLAYDIIVVVVCFTGIVVLSACLFIDICDKFVECQVIDE